MSFLATTAYHQTHLLAKRGWAFHHHTDVLQQTDVQVIISTEDVLTHHVDQPKEKAGSLSISHVHFSSHYNTEEVHKHTAFWQSVAMFGHTWLFNRLLLKQQVAGTSYQHTTPHWLLP